MRLSPVAFLRAIADELQGSGPFEILRAFLVSPLPRRYWGGASGTGLLLSGLAQIAMCGAGLIQSYHAYSGPVSDALASVTLEAAVANGEKRAHAAPAMAFGALTPLAFFAVSASGRLFAYGVFSGLVRVIGYAADHPGGDPVLTLVDDFAWDAARGLRVAFERTTSRWRR